MWAKHKQSGFTIVELLIVIVVIAILAAITIVAFNGIQDRARSSAASSSSTQAAKKIKVWQVDNELQSPDCPKFYELVTGTTNGAPAIPTPPAVCSFTYKDSNYQYSPSSTVAGGYCVTTTVATKSYKVSESQTPISGGCNGHAQSGVATITNWAINPNAAGSTIAAFGFAGTPAPSTRSISSDRSHSGTTSLKTEITGTGQTGSQIKVPASTLRINTGEKISWSFWTYSTKAGSLTPYIDSSRVSDGGYAGGASTAVSIPANTWTKVSGTFTATVDIYITQIGGYNLSVVSGDIVWFDEFMVTKTDTVQNFADGDSTNWTWNGTANSATSTGLPQ